MVAQKKKGNAFRAASSFLCVTLMFERNVVNWEWLMAPLMGAPVKVLHVGCSDGESACWLLRHVLTHHDASLTILDPFEDHPLEVFAHDVADHKTRIVQDHHDALKREPDDHYDLVYVESSHDAMDVLRNAVFSFAALKPGGILLFDNAQDKTVRRALKMFLSCYEGAYSNGGAAHQLFIRKKN